MQHRLHQAVAEADTAFQGATKTRWYLLLTTHHGAAMADQFPVAGEGGRWIIQAEQFLWVVVAEPAIRTIMAGGAGGNGGGLFYLVNYGTVSGSGQIMANGSNGSNTGSSGFDGGIDGAGGAGAGGTIILNSSDAISGISATANGGSGGTQTVSLLFDPNEAEGPGGGGGGGYIALSNGSITCTANGGSNGSNEFECAHEISLQRIQPKAEQARTMQ